MAGTATAGATTARIVGVRSFPARRPGLKGFFESMFLPTRAVGLVELAVAGLAALALLLLARRARDRPAMGHAAVFAAGIVVGALAGASLVGPPFAWLLWWTAAPAAAGLIAAALLAVRSKRSEGPTRARIPAIAGMVIAVGVTTWALLLPHIGPRPVAGVATTWRALDPLVTARPSAP